MKRGELKEITIVPGLDANEHRALDLTWRRKPGLIGWLETTNHKDIAMRYIITAMIFFLLAGLLAALMRIQLAFPQNTFIGPDLYDQFFTVHGTTMMFLFAVPITEAIGIYFVPLMVGTRNVAFPRLNAFGYYVYLGGGILLYAGLFLNIGPDTGWFSYVPLAGPQFSPGKRVDFWAQMITLTEIAGLTTAVEIIVTVFKQRAVGMSLNRIPLFVWAMVVTSFMVIFAMPSVMLASGYLAMDRLAHVNTHFFNPAEGGDALLYQHIFWFFGHPEVYIIFIPATGFISTIVPTFARRKIYGYTALVLALISTAFIGFGLWVHHMFATPVAELGQSFFTAASMIIAIPAGVQIFCWIATLWTGKRVAPLTPGIVASAVPSGQIANAVAPTAGALGIGHATTREAATMPAITPTRYRKWNIQTPLLWVGGFLSLFVFGGLSGIMLASVPIDLQVHDTYFVVAHFHYVLIGGAVFPLFGAFYYWFPKWTGRMLSESLGKVNFWLFFIGFNLTFFPMHNLGLKGMPRRIYTYVPETGWGSLNLLATIGAGIIGLSVITFLVNVLWSRKRGPLAGNNPWGAGTLEWATTSPPQSYNFLYLPTVRGRDALWDQPHISPVVTGVRSDIRQVLNTTMLEAAPDHLYEMAGDSIYPLLLAIPVCATIATGIFTPWAYPYGAFLTFLAFIPWFWSGTEEAKQHRDKKDKRSGELETPAPLPVAEQVASAP